MKFKKRLLIPIFIFLAAFGGGWLVMAQWKVKPSRALNPVSPYISLLNSRDNLSQKQEQQKTAIKKIQAEKNQLQQTLRNQRKISQDNLEELNRLQKAVGLTEISGEGVEIILDDSQQVLDDDSIIHAADLRDLVNFLWLNKTEAISINNERIVATTSIDCIVNTVLINSTKLTPPFIAKVIGKNSDELNDRLGDKNNLTDLNRRRELFNLVFRWQKNKDLTIPAFSGSFKLDYVQ